MKFGKCKGCKKWKLLTRHSRTGGHQPPYDYLCRECHDEEHGITPDKERRYFRKHQKYQPGTKRMHKKGK